MILHLLSFPIVQAPMAGGVSNPTLASAVSNAGGLGFLAAGYKTAEQLEEEILKLRGMTDAPFGVNLFAPSNDSVNLESLLEYQQQLTDEAHRLDTSLGLPKYDDDQWEDKLSVLLKHKVPVVSFTFGCPSSEVITLLKNNKSWIIVTVTTPEEALEASKAGADALCVQGIEAGGHRASFVNHPSLDDDRSLLVLLNLISQVVDLPLIAAGGIMSGRDIAAVLTAGASAVQLGTAFLRCPESGTHPVHKRALSDPRFTSTALTRAFTGRRARGLVNDFLSKYSHIAPAAYPHIHHVTKDLRKHAGHAKDPETMSLWAGQGYPLTKEMPVEELIKQLINQTLKAFEDAENIRRNLLSKQGM